MNSTIVRSTSFDLLRDVNKAAMRTTSSLNDLLNNTLKVIGDALNSNMCALYGSNRINGFSFMTGYRLNGKVYAENLIKLIYNQVENSVKNKCITFAYIEAVKVVYIAPIKIGKSYGVMVLGFDKELDAFSLELIKSIGDILSSAIDRFYLLQQIDKQRLSTVKSLVVAMKAKDVYTQGHSQRVAKFSKLIGTHMKLKDSVITDLEIAGLVHDIGKIGISDQILAKSDKLTEDEFEAMRQHPEIGVKILQPLNVSENVMIGTLLHHKRYDLKGYPFNVNIDKLPLVPAIIGVADAFDAMTSKRSYRKAFSKLEAVEELKRFRGTQFHPEIVDVVEELVSIGKL